MKISVRIKNVRLKVKFKETGEVELSRPTEAACPGEEAGLTNYEDSNGGIPLYITESAQIIAEALSLEAEEKFDQSIASYRSAIGREYNKIFRYFFPQLILLLQSILNVEFMCGLLFY